MASVLLTGASGHLGGALLPRLRDATPSEVEIVVLARRPFAAPAGVRVLRGDLERPRLGLEPDAEAALARGLVLLYHCAAATKFALPLEAARRVNVEGTRALLALAARAPGLRRFHHVSTAYAEGCRNSYERSKLEAEEAVRASGLPFTIFRPSVIVGDARTGRTRAWNVIYPPMRLAWHDRLRSLPCAAGAALDIVPVDFVAEAVLALGAREDTLGRTLPLVSGRPIAVPDLVRLLADALDRARTARGLPKIRRPQLLPPALVRDTALEPLTPYLAGEAPHFERAEGLAEAPALESYVDGLIEYAIANDFGAGAEEAAA